MIGCKRYPDATCLTVTCDGGRSNGSRVRLWKPELQGLASDQHRVTGIGHHRTGRYQLAVPRMARAPLLPVTAAGVAAGLLAAGTETSASAIALAGADLTRLLRAIALLKVAVVAARRGGPWCGRGKASMVGLPPTMTMEAGGKVRDERLADLSESRLIRSPVFGRLCALQCAGPMTVPAESL